MSLGIRTFYPISLWVLLNPPFASDARLSPSTRALFSPFIGQQRHKRICISSIGRLYFLLESLNKFMLCLYQEMKYSLELLVVVAEGCGGVGWGGGVESPFKGPICYFNPELTWEGFYRRTCLRTV